MVHKGVRKECEICGKVLSDLWKHMRTVHGQYRRKAKIPKDNEGGEEDDEDENDEEEELILDADDIADEKKPNITLKHIPSRRQVRIIYENDRLTCNVFSRF